MLAYFDETESLPCGVCDVCIRNRRRLQTSLEKQVIYSEIKERLNQGPQGVHELISGYSSLKKESALLVLREMLDEEDIWLDKVQRIEWRGKK